MLVWFSRACAPAVLQTAGANTPDSVLGPTQTNMRKEEEVEWTSPLGLPHGDLDPQVAVDGDGQQRQDGTLREDEHGAGEQQAAVEVRLESDADGDGERDDESPHRNVSQGQGDDEAEGGVSQGFVDPHRPHHHHVPDHWGHRDQDLHPDVEGLPHRSPGHPGRAGGDPRCPFCPYGDLQTGCAFMMPPLSRSPNLTRDKSSLLRGMQDESAARGE